MSPPIGATRVAPPSRRLDRALVDPVAVGPEHLHRVVDQLDRLVEPQLDRRRHGVDHAVGRGDRPDQGGVGPRRRRPAGQQRRRQQPRGQHRRRAAEQAGTTGSTRAHGRPGYARTRRGSGRSPGALTGAGAADLRDRGGWATGSSRGWRLDGLGLAPRAPAGSRPPAGRTCPRPGRRGRCGSPPRPARPGGRTRPPAGRGSLRRRGRCRPSRAAPGATPARRPGGAIGTASTTSASDWARTDATTRSSHAIPTRAAARATDDGAGCTAIPSSPRRRAANRTIPWNPGSPAARMHGGRPASRSATARSTTSPRSPHTSARSPRMSAGQQGELVGVAQQHRRLPEGALGLCTEPLPAEQSHDRDRGGRRLGHAPAAVAQARAKAATGDGSPPGWTWR